MPTTRFKELVMVTSDPVSVQTLRNVEALSTADRNVMTAAVHEDGISIAASLAGPTSTTPDKDAPEAIVV
jgi:hypothetical protein